MLAPQCGLVAITLLLSAYFGEIHAEVCYGENLCFSTSLPCWSEDSPHAPRHPDAFSTRFFLYNRNNTWRNKCYRAWPSELDWNDPDSCDEFDPGVKTVVLVHGFMTSYKTGFFFQQCHAFLEHSDVNIIMVDWEEGAEGPLHRYFQARQDTRLVGRKLGLLLELLHNVTGLQYADVHIVGHSLGAHLAGFAGEYLSGQIGRITGLDPAKPLFGQYLYLLDCRLDTGDAQFVDIIHSDPLHFYGLETPIGHQDFYVNRGRWSQPGCSFWFFACSHMRAVDLFVASLENSANSSQGCYYPTTPCDSGQQCGPGTGQECPVMGILAGSGPSGKFCIDDDCY